MVVRFKGTGTHTGEYSGIPPTGKKIAITGVLIHRIVDGRIVEAWAVDDLLDFCKKTRC